MRSSSNSRRPWRNLFSSGRWQRFKGTAQLRSSREADTTPSPCEDDTASNDDHADLRTPEVVTNETSAMPATPEHTDQQMRGDETPMKQLVRSASQSRKGSLCADDVGERVLATSYGTGVLRFYGADASSGKTHCGVELDEPIGLHNGTIDGHVYFKCDPKCGILVAPKKVKLESSLQKRKSSRWWINSNCDGSSRRSSASKKRAELDNGSLLSEYSLVSVSTVHSTTSDVEPKRVASDLSICSKQSAVSTMSDFVLVSATPSQTEITTY